MAARYPLLGGSVRARLPSSASSTSSASSAARRFFSPLVTSFSSSITICDRPFAITVFSHGVTSIGWPVVRSMN